MTKTAWTIRRVEPGVWVTDHPVYGPYHLVDSYAEAHEAIRGQEIEWLHNGFKLESLDLN